ncbi:MAG TPA: MotA/TolQ/ExbB proton channel family protein [Bacteroidia bacterium]|jgi:biopolymer transport protein ExbB
MLNFILLQIQGVTGATGAMDTVKKVVTSSPSPTLPDVPKEQALSLFELLMKGGWVMIPIALLLLIALYVFFERLITILRSGRSDKNFMNNIRDFLTSGNIDAAKAFCRSHDSPQARVVEKGISRIGKPIKEIEEAMEDVGRLEVYRLEKNLSTLSIVGKIAPMLGFIGTIIGVINIFYKISLVNQVHIDVISGGLYQKLVTSASGLTIGILAFIGYHILSSMVDKIVNRVETTSVEFIDLLNQPSK